MLYTKEEVKRHITQDDCWVIAHRQVYDVTHFLQLHPNHISIILPKAGQDVSSDFDFHTRQMKKVWKKYHIGYVISVSLQNIIHIFTK